MNQTLLNNVLALLASVVPQIVEKFTGPHRSELDAHRAELDAIRAELDALKSAKVAK